MSISTAATGSPIQKPNNVFQFVDPQSGILSEHGIQLMNQWYNFIVGMNRITPCNATGKNTITLTPLTASPLIEKYVDYEIFTFVAEQTSDGSVTATPAFFGSDPARGVAKALVAAGSSRPADRLAV